MGAADDLLAEYDESEASPVAAVNTKKYPSFSELVGESASMHAAPVESPEPVAVAPTAEQKSQRKQAAMSQLESGLRRDAAKAVGYAGLRGATWNGIDTLVGTGEDLGEAVGSADWANGSVLSKIPEKLWPTSIAGPQPMKNATGSPRPADPWAYEKARAQYQQDEARAREGNEGKAFLAELAGGVIPTIATAGAGAPVALAGRTIPASTVGLVRNVAAPGFVAGAMAEPSNDIRAQARSGLEGMALALGTNAAVSPVVNKLVSKSPERMGRNLIKDVGVSEEGASATSSAKQRLTEKKEGVISELSGKENRDLRSAVRGKADDAISSVESRIARISEPRDGLYKSLDSVKQIDLASINKGLNEAIKGAKNPSEEYVLKATLDDLNNFWIPKWTREGTLIQQPNRPAAVSSLAAREWVTQAQKPAAQVLGSINQTEHKALKDATADAVTGVWQRHLDDVAKEGPQAKALVGAVREYDKRASSLLEMKQTLEQRRIKEEQAAVGFAQKAKHGVEGLALAGAGAAELAGHHGALLPTLGALTASKALPPTVRAINDEVMVPLALAIRRGATWAQVTDYAARTGLPQGVARAAFDRYSIWNKGKEQ